MPPGHYLVTSDTANLLVNGVDLTLVGETLLPENTLVRLPDNENHFLGILTEMYDPNSFAFNAPNQTPPHTTHKGSRSNPSLFAGETIYFLKESWFLCLPRIPIRVHVVIPSLRL